MPLSIQKRWEIIFLFKHPRGPKMKQSAIAKYLKISKSAVAYWIERYQKTGDVQTQEGRGKKRKTTEKSDKF